MCERCVEELAEALAESEARAVALLPEAERIVVNSTTGYLEPSLPELLLRAAQACPTEVANLRRILLFLAETNAGSCFEVQMGATWDEEMKASTFRALDTLFGAVWEHTLSVWDTHWQKVQAQQGQAPVIPLFAPKGGKAN
jgi:hypothetical protein